MQDRRPVIGIIACAVVMTIASIFNRIELVIAIALGIGQIRASCGDEETAGIVTEPIGGFFPPWLMILGLVAAVLTILILLITQ